MSDILDSAKNAVPQDSSSGDQGASPVPGQLSPSGSEAAAGSGPAPTASKPDKAAAAKRATLAAFEAVKRKRGQRGPDKGPRKPAQRVPVAEVGRGAFPPPLADETPPVAPVPGVDDRAAEARQAFERALKVIVGQADRLAQSAIYLHARRCVHDEAVAEAARKSVAMPEADKSALAFTGAHVWEKYLGAITDPVEIAFWSVAVGWLGSFGAAWWQLEQAGKKLVALPGAGGLPVNEA